MSEAHPLTEYRKAGNLSRKDLAEILGVERMTVYRWETGARKIDHELVPAISEKTGIPKSELRPDLAALFTESAP